MDNEPLVAELELFFRENPEMRQFVSDEVRNLCHTLNGSVLDEKVYGQIAYHGMLIQLPRRQVEQIIENPDVNLIQCEQIMFFRPAGQSIKSTDEAIEIEEDVEEAEVGLNLNNSRVALLDGFPLENHFYLRNRIEVEDPDGLGTNYPANERKHGTSMASLIINGDINNEEPYKPNSLLYVRPIMHFDGNRESVPKNRLLIDLIHQAVREIKQKPETKDVHLINLCICDPYRPFYYGLSSIAKMLDWLSWQYNVLFIVSAGNYTEDMEIPKENGRPLGNLNEEELQEKTITTLHKDQRLRRLLAPAESINAITVGGINNDGSGDFPRRHLELFYDNDLPAPYNPVTFGFRRSVKPDLVEQGGKSLFMEHGSTPEYTTLRLVDQPARPPGIKVAYPSNSVNISDKGIGYILGTSNAAALTSRNALKIMETLDELNAPGLGIDSINEEFYPVLSKCLLVHSTTWGHTGQQLESILKNNGVQGHKVKKEIQKFLGYGKTNISTAIECLQNRATVIGYDTLEVSEGGIYEFPIPACINNTRAPRRIIITLAWFSPINVNHKNYRKCHLELAPQNLEHFFPQSKRKPEVHAHNYIKGTVDHRVYGINQPRDPINYNEETLRVKIACREDAENLDETIRYAIAVTFEENSGADLPVYEEIREYIQQAVRIRGA